MIANWGCISYKTWIQTCDKIVTEICYVSVIYYNGVLIQLFMSTENNMQQRTVTNIEFFCELLIRGTLLGGMIDFILLMNMELKLQSITEYNNGLG